MGRLFPGKKTPHAFEKSSGLPAMLQPLARGVCVAVYFSGNGNREDPGRVLPADDCLWNGISIAETAGIHGNYFYSLSVNISMAYG